MPICGLGLTYFGLILSAWGVLQLLFIGVCLQLRSVAFVDDVLPNNNEHPKGDLLSALELGFARGALNCWVAALLYGLTFCLSAYQYWVHKNHVQEVKSEQFY